MLINTHADAIMYVRHKRLALDMTQEQLAKKVGMSRQWVRNLESGIGAPSFPKMLAVLQALGLELEAYEATSDPERGCCTSR